MYETLQAELGPRLSPGATITRTPPSRWSAYEVPAPIAVVEVGNEEDVATTVKYCNAQNLPVLARNGGNGWTKFPQTKNLVLISLVNLTSVIVSADKKTATLGGGAKVSDAIAAADAAGVLVMTGNCNSVGVLGAFLGGGYGNTMGMYGFGVDSILEMRVVTADGEVRTVSATKEQDLFWALRGAGPNFGIVVSATVKAYAMADAERSAWTGALIFSSEQLEQVVQAIQELELAVRMVVFMYLAGSGPPAHAPVVIVTPWLFQGTPETGRAAFKSLYDIGPMVDTTAVLPYTQWNTGGDPFCVHSGRKPAVAAGFDKLDPKAWRGVWDKYAEFQKKPSAHQSALLLEVYPMNEIRFAGKKSAAFTHRKTRFQCIVMPWYEDSGLDGEAVRFAKETRDLLRMSGGGERNAPYINLCHGDESLEEVYGDSLPRLRELKRVWDPLNRFNQWFNIQ